MNAFMFTAIYIFFICQDESLPANLAINTEKLTFTYTSNLYSLGVAIAIARAGTCTKALLSFQ